MEKRINKHVHTWVGTFLFGGLGVDRFMRGQIKFGIIKLIICFFPILLDMRRVSISGLLLFFTVLDRAWSLFGNIKTIMFTHGYLFKNFKWLLFFLFSFLGSVWILIDWIIALTKLGKYENKFAFNSSGKWDESFTKESLEKEEERKQQEIERREKYKKDILSGIISYDEEFKKAQKIEDEFLKYKSNYIENMKKFISLQKELQDGTRTGSWDTMWFRETVDKIKSIKFDSPYFTYDEALLSDLYEINGDSHINKLKYDIRDTCLEFQNFYMGYSRYISCL